MRTVGLKGPLLLSSWGYDMGGKPVPAKSKEGDDSFRFKPFFAAQRSTWKTGPVHLLWDEERQVWTGGLPMLMGVATSDIEAPEDHASTSSTHGTMEDALSALINLGYKKPQAEMALKTVTSDSESITEIKNI